MASSSRFPPSVKSEVIDISSDSEDEVYYESDSDGSDDYPYGWIRSNDPRFVGKEVRVGELPFGPGFVKLITKSQAKKGQALAVPAWFVEMWLDRKYKKVIWVYEYVKLYTVKVSWHYPTGNQCSFAKGWYDFKVENHVGPGDHICCMPTVFEDVFAISISRAADRLGE